MEVVPEISDIVFSDFHRPHPGVHLPRLASLFAISDFENVQEVEITQHGLRISFDFVAIEPNGKDRGDLLGHIESETEEQRTDVIGFDGLRHRLTPGLVE